MTSVACESPICCGVGASSAAPEGVSSVQPTSGGVTAGTSARAVALAPVASDPSSGWEPGVASSAARDVTASSSTGSIASPHSVTASAWMDCMSSSESLAPPAVIAEIRFVIRPTRVPGSYCAPR
jgi:hypothetical protein